MKTDIVTGKLFTINQVVRIIVTVATAVFTLTTIYNRFLIMEQQINTLEERIEKKDTRLKKEQVEQWNAINSKVDK